MEALQKRFSPLVLLNAPKEHHVAGRDLIRQLNTQIFSFQVMEDGSMKTMTSYCRFMLLSDYLVRLNDPIHSIASLECKSIWANFKSTDPQNLVESALRSAVRQIDSILFDTVMTDALTTFDRPVAVLHLFDPGLSEDPEEIRDQLVDLPLKNFVEVSLLFGNQEEVNFPYVNVLDWSLPLWKEMVDRLFAIKIYSFIMTTISECTSKNSYRESQTSLTFGLATKFLSLGKKYLGQQQSSLLNLKHTEETVLSVGDNTPISSVVSLAESEFSLRRAADLSFMMKNYRKAQSLFDGLRREAQTSKSWAIAASAQFWFQLCSFITGNATELNSRDMDAIVNQFLLAKESQFAAVFLTSCLAFVGTGPDKIFSCFSRICQSSVERTFAIHLLFKQISVALQLEKRRLALLLMERLAAFTASIGATDLTLQTYKSAALLVEGQDLQRFFIKIYRNILAKDTESDAAHILSRNDDILPSEELVKCWKLLGDEVTPQRLIVKAFEITCGTRMLASPFGINDHAVLKAFTDYIRNFKDRLVDPLDVLIDTQVAKVWSSEGIHIMVALQNDIGLAFSGVRDMSLNGIDTNGQVYTIVANTTTDVAGYSLTEISFGVDHLNAGQYLFTHLIFEWNSIRFKIPLPKHKYRLTLTSAQRQNPTYSAYKGNMLVVDPEGIEATFRLLGEAHVVGVDQELIFELTSHSSSPMDILTSCDDLMPLDREWTRAGEMNVLAGVTSGTILFKAKLHMEGAFDFIICLHPRNDPTQLYPHRVRVRAQRVITIQKSKQIATLNGPLISLQLVSHAPDTIRVFEASVGGIGPLGLHHFILRPEIPFWLSFPDAHDDDLVLRLQDGRIFELAVPHDDMVDRATVTLGSQRQVDKLLVQEASVEAEDPITLQDSLSAVWLGKIKASGAAKVEIVCLNGEWGVVPVAPGQDLLVKRV